MGQCEFSVSEPPNQKGVMTIYLEGALILNCSSDGP